MKTKAERELALQKTIGANLKTARIQSRMSLSEVMIAVWGTSSTKNRISEIETGARMPTVYTLMRLSVLYSVSLDFIFGLSSEIDRDHQSAKAGIIIQGLRSTALDIMDQIGITLASQISAMPKPESIQLLECSKDLLDRILKVKSNLNLDSDAVFAEMQEEIEQLDKAYKTLEHSIKRRQRLFELEMLNHIEHYQGENSNEYLTDHQVGLDNPYQFSKTDTSDMDFFELDLQDNIISKQPVGSD